MVKNLITLNNWANEDTGRISLKFFWNIRLKYFLNLKILKK